MKITTVEAFCLRLPPGSPPSNSAADASIVHIGTDAGIDGYAEIDSNPWAIRAIVEAPTDTGLRQGLRGLLVGKSPLEPAQRWAEMYQETINYGRAGAVIHAMAGIDQALWDIKGKALGQPVHALLGGALRRRLRAYATRGFATTSEESAARAAALCDQDFTAVKLGWGPFGRDAAADERMVAAARQAIGTKIELMVDCGFPWDAETAIQRCRQLAPYGLSFVEEPLPPDDFAGYRQLCAATELTIATGEQETTLGGFAQLVESGIGLAQIDVSRVGITQALRIAAQAAAHNVPCANHSFGTDLNLAAALHVMACVTKPLILEFAVEPSPYRETLTRNRIRAVDGHVEVPDAPGLGIEIDLDALRRYQI